MTYETTRLTYQSRLIYENILSEALKRCLKERVDSPNDDYLRAVKALSMAMPSKIKKEYGKWREKEQDVNGKNQTEIHNDILEYLLLRMEKYNLLIPEKAIPRGGGYR